MLFISPRNGKAGTMPGAHLVSRSSPSPAVPCANYTAKPEASQAGEAWHRGGQIPPVPNSPCVPKYPGVRGEALACLSQAMKGALA